LGEKSNNGDYGDSVDDDDDYDDDEVDIEVDIEEVYIQFSRVFQRHVVYQCRRNDSNKRNNSFGNSFDTTRTSSSSTSTTPIPTRRTIQSFQFLDEAIKHHPHARVVAPFDLPFPPPSCSLVYPDEIDAATATGDDDGRSTRLTVCRGRLIDTEVEQEECETTLAGMGLWTLCELEYDTPNHGDTATTHHGDSTNRNNGNGNGEEEYDAQRQSHEALRTLLRLVSPRESNFDFVPRHFFRLDPRRFAMRGITSEIITENHERVVGLLSRGMENYVGGGEVERRRSSSIGSDGVGGGVIGGGSDEVVGLAMDPVDVRFVLQNFPQLCLYDCDELESLVRFMLRPLPPRGSIPENGGGDGIANVDWPSISGMGYGAGLTIEQATRAIRMMPELLALYYEDSRKPSMVYIYNQMRTPVPPKLIDEANQQLNLEGADPSDACTFGYLRSLGIEWGQIRILLSSLPLWTTSNLDPGWELLQKGPVRSKLKRPALDFLRQRLQIGPGDVYRLLKTHTRLSTYDACRNMLPKLDNLQSKLKLSSADLKKLILRMPSLMGMGMSAFDDRMKFFMEEGM